MAPQQYRSEWRHIGIDIRAFTAWQDYSGYGVRVGVIDDGVQSTHPDLDANTDTTTDYDARDNDNNADASASDDAHGVAVAGLIAAERFNGIGVVGVTYDATIVGFRMGYGSNGTLDQITNNFARQTGVDVSNNSWGFGGFFFDDLDSSTFAATNTAIRSAITTRRGGLGTSIVFAAGNSRLDGQNTNYHGFQNAREIITVAAIEDDGTYSYYSTPGASILVASPGQVARQHCDDRPYRQRRLRSHRLHVAL